MGKKGIGHILKACWDWLASKPDPNHEPRFVTLRDMSEPGNSRSLTASLVGEDLVIEGRDFGTSVKGVMGSSEYEWAWTIKAAHIPQLKEALGAANQQVLPSLAARFSGEAASDLAAFLEEHQIQNEFWSRVGD